MATHQDDENHGYGYSNEDSERTKGGVVDTRLKQTQIQVDEVLDIMRDNVDSVIKRGENLETLDQRAEDLENNAKNFVTNAVKLKRKHWWQNTKMTIIFGIICVILLIIVIALLFY